MTDPTPTDPRLAEAVASVELDQPGNGGAHTRKPSQVGTAGAPRDAEEGARTGAGEEIGFLVVYRDEATGAWLSDWDGVVYRDVENARQEARYAAASGDVAGPVRVVKLVTIETEESRG